MNGVMTGLLYTSLDLLNANALAAIAASGEAATTRFFRSSRSNDRLDGTMISAVYLFNPFTIVACLGRSTNAFTNTAIIHAVSNAILANNFKSIFALAMASYLSMYPALLFAPVVLLCWDRAAQYGKPHVAGVTYGMNQSALLLGSINGLLWLSYVVTGGSWDFVSATYGVQLLVPDLTPNVGLWWYFFIEIFDSFREFFWACSGCI